MPKSALIVVDLQNDFCQGGSLEVPDGDAVVPLANALQKYFALCVATKDWHPQNHVSFAANHPGRQVGDIINVDNIEQVLWPVHCVQNSKGAEFHPEFDPSTLDKVIYKGTDPSIDSYSTFFDNKHLRKTGLGDYLHEQGVTDVYLLGLATDYCVKYSCLDALALGFTVYLIQDACRGVNVKPGDVERAVQVMREAGAIMITSKEVMDANS